MPSVEPGAFLYSSIIIIRIRINITRLIIKPSACFGGAETQQLEQRAVFFGPTLSRMYGESPLNIFFRFCPKPKRMQQILIAVVHAGGGVCRLDGGGGVC